MFNTLPTRFRHYEVLKLLGGGGFGVVYLARDTDLKRLVVLKMLHPHLAAQPDMVRRFVLEARAMARLDHVNIVRVNQVKSDPQHPPFFEMEYVQGQTLAKYRASQVLSLRQAMPILKQMAAALDAAHQQKIIHRDVKPDNVLIKPDGTLKLTDFGIIKLLDVTGTLHPSTGGIIGTPSYMAPEQADISRKHEIGPGSDIYALGVVAFELLTGNLPFFGAPAVAILYAHAHTPPPNPRTFNSNLPVPIVQVLLKALAKQPADRYPSAMAFVDALEQAALGGKAINAPTAPAIAPATTPPPPMASPISTASTDTAQPISQTFATQRKPDRPILIALALIILMATIIIALLLRTLISPEPTIVIATVVPAEPIAPEEQAKPASDNATMTGQDGMILLYVPEGEFLRGSNEDDPLALDNEKPQRSIYLDAFWIDKTEVTNEMFARFVDETGHQTDAEKSGWAYAFIEESWVVTDGAEWRHPHGPNSSLEGLQQHPVVQVSWNDAKAYCEWTGRRLPTEAEWEKAARGTEGQIYSWGNEDLADNQANLCDKNCPYSNNRIDSIDDGYEFTAPVGSYPDGASPYGALDMAGNVWEWTADWYDEEYYQNSPERNPQGPDTGKPIVVRGGSWYDGTQKIRVGARDSYDPANRVDDYGFRCVVSE